MRRKKTPIAILRASKLCGDVARRTDRPRTAVADYAARYSYLEPHMIEEAAHAYLEGWDAADAALARGEARHRRLY